MPAHSRYRMPSLASSLSCLLPQWFLDQIKADPNLELVGAHCHLGSTITKVGARACVCCGSCGWKLLHALLLLTACATAASMECAAWNVLPGMCRLLSFPRNVSLQVQVNIFRDATLLMVDFIKQIRAQVGQLQLF